MAQRIFDPVAQEIEFDFEKSNFFRVIVADGVMGGITPQGRIHMALYNERQPIPKKMFHKIEPSGMVGAELIDKREGRSGIFREVEVDVHLSLEAAVALRGWLDEKIKQLEELQAAKAGGKL